MVGIIAKERFLNLEKFVEKIVKLDNRIVSVILNINPKKTNVILGENSITLYGKDFITDDINGINFNISLASYQVKSCPNEGYYIQKL